MTVSTQITRVIVEGDGSTSTFSYSFPIPGSTSTDQTNCQLILTDSDSVSTTLANNLWSITGIVHDITDGVGGTFTYPLSGSPVSTGSFLTLNRIVPYLQPTELTGQGAYSPAVVMNALDNLALQTEQLNTSALQSVRAPITDPALDDLPAAALRANLLLGFDSTGQPVAVPASSGGGGGDGLFVSVKDYGAVGNGSADDTAALISAAAGGVSLVFPPGTYKVTNNITFPTEIWFLNGAVLNVATTGKTITFSGGLMAPLTTIFTLTGSAKILFTIASQRFAYPEWWGAVPYLASTLPVSSPTYSDTAIQAAIGSLASIIRIQGADYYLNAALTMSNSSQVMEGVSSTQNGGNGASRFVIKSAVHDGLLVGLASQPAAAPTTNWIEHVAVRHLTIWRTVAPTSIQNTVGFNGYETSPTGLRLQWCLGTDIEDVVTMNHSNGFFITGNVDCTLTRCKALRTIAPNGSGFDYFHGFSQDGTVPVSPWVVAGCNASMYYDHCIAGGTGATFPGGSVGLAMYGPFSDTFVDRCESALLATGISILGTSSTTTTPDNEDVKIIGAILDGCATAGISISTTNKATQIRILGCYLGILGGGKGISIATNAGIISSTGNQIVAAATSVTGIYLSACIMFSSVNDLITDCSTPVSLVSSSGLNRIESTINNPNLACTNGVTLDATSFRSIIKPIVQGSFTNGINLASGAGFNECNPSGINAGSNKLIYNGSAVTSVGAFGSTNYATGVMN